MNTNEFEPIELMPLCDGQLLLARRIIQSAHYENQTDASTNLAVWFQFQSQQRIIRNLEELGLMVSELNCTLILWVQDHETQFAQILAALLGLGRVVSSVDLFSFVEERYGLSVSQHLPRLEGDKLRFLCGQFRLDADHAISDISLDLGSLELEVRRIV